MKHNILKELDITELEERVEFGLCGGSGGGDGGGGNPGEGCTGGGPTETCEEY